MRYFPKKNRTPIVIDINQCMKDSFVRQPSLVDSFYFEETIDSEGNKRQVYHNPLYMLFNQERIDRMGPAAVQQWLQSLEAAGSSSLAEVRKNCTDEDLMSMIMSRHYQHPVEVERYLASLNARADRFNEEVERVRAEMEAERQKQVEQLDPIV